MVRFARGLFLAAVLAAVGSPAGALAESAGSGPGCLPGQPAVAYRTGGRLVEPQPSPAPVPCGMHTGFAGGESAIAVTNSGAVLYSPAVQAITGTNVQAQYFLGGNSGFALSTDLGATWSFDDPISVNLEAGPSRRTIT